MFMKTKEDTLSAFMMECKVTLGVNAQVIHVNLQPTLSDHVCEDVVHKGLESGRSITEPKEHDSWFKESKRGDECSLPLVFFSNANVVESPSDIELGKDHRVLHIVDQFRDKGQWVCIADSVGIQVLIVLARAERTIFFCNEEERGGLWGFGQNNSSGFEVFLDENFAYLLFLWIKGIYLSNLRNK